MGLYFVPPRLTRAVHHTFLQNVLPELLQDVALQIRINLWFVHNRVPSPLLLEFREFLYEVFLEQCMG